MPIELLDNQDETVKIDRGGMLAVVEQFAQMLLQADNFSIPALPKRSKLNKVIIAGMGGSAIAGDICAEAFKSRANVPILSNRSYLLPAFAGKGSLLIAISYSGDTEETLQSVREAEKRKLPIICITSGGKLKEIADSNRHPLILIPKGYQPRAALPFILIPLAKCLSKLGIISANEPEIKEAISLSTRLKGIYGFSSPAKENPAKQMAKKLRGKIPIVFGTTDSTFCAAMRMKTQFNENSKTTALINNFPELDHNEIINLAKLKRNAHPFSLLVLRRDDDLERIKKRIEITKSLVSPCVGGITEVWAQGRNPLAKIASLVIFGDYLSVYLAILNGIDPTPVDAISRLKKEMSR